MNASKIFLTVFCQLAISVCSMAEDGFAVKQSTDSLAIRFANEPVAEYVFQDAKILRPYFTRVHVPGGMQITRNHPPIQGKDATDHDTMHPGLWLAFGDINGQDFWRNKAVIKHNRFIAPAVVNDGNLTFSTESSLQTSEGKRMGTQISRFIFSKKSGGYLLVWDVAFLATEQDLCFGDQEEMGLGVRVSTAITEKNGGLISSSTGAKGAKETWGKAHGWCDYSGVIGDAKAGIAIIPDPKNFRPSWFHNRDYGLMVANPFGRKAMNQGEVSSIVVKKGEELRLRFAVFFHAEKPSENTDLNRISGGLWK